MGVGHTRRLGAPGRAGGQKRWELGGGLVVALEAMCPCASYPLARQYEVKALAKEPLHFGNPLQHHALGREDEHAIDQTAQLDFLEHQARFDGLAQADRSGLQRNITLSSYSLAPQVNRSPHMCGRDFPGDGNQASVAHGGLGHSNAHAEALHNAQNAHGLGEFEVAVVGEVRLAEILLIHDSEWPAGG